MVSALKLNCTHHTIHQAHQTIIGYYYRLVGGAVASWLVHSTPDRVVRVRGSSPGRGHCVVFLGRTLYSHSASLHPGVQMGTSKNAGGKPAME